MKGKIYNVNFTNHIRFVRKLVFCAIMLGYSFSFSQQNLIALSHSNPTNESSLQSGIFVEKGTIIFDSSKAENKNPKTEQDVSTKTSSIQDVIYITEGTQIYTDEISLNTKVIELKVTKNHLLTENSTKTQKKQREKIASKKNYTKSIFAKTLFNSTGSSSHISQYNQEKNIGISTNNNYSKGKKLILEQNDCNSKNIFSFNSIQSQPYTSVYNSLLVFENCFSRPPPLVS